MNKRNLSSRFAANSLSDKALVWNQVLDSVRCFVMSLTTPMHSILHKQQTVSWFVQLVLPFVHMYAAVQQFAPFDTALAQSQGETESV